MKRGGPLARRTELRRTPLRKRVTEATAAGRRLFAQSGDVVIDRAGARCEGCGSGDWLRRHHRQPRQMGGSREEYVNLPSALLMLCRSCDEIVENTDRAEAYRLGWLVERPQRPVDVPVRLFGRGWVLLDDLGGCRAADEPMEMTA